MKRCLLTGINSPRPPKRRAKGMARNICADLREDSRLCREWEHQEGDPEVRKCLAQLALRLDETAALLERDAAGRRGKRPHPETMGRARRWHMQAEEYRAVAENMKHPRSRATYLSLAESY